METSKGQPYRDLIAWKKGIELVTEIYRLTQELPREEPYGLSNQLRRTAELGHILNGLFASIQPKKHAHDL